MAKMLEKCFFKKESFKSVFKNGYRGAILNVRRHAVFQSVGAANVLKLK